MLKLCVQSGVLIKQLACYICGIVVVLVAHRQAERYSEMEPCKSRSTTTSLSEVDGSSQCRLTTERDELWRMEAEDGAIDHNPRHTWLKVNHGDNYRRGVLMGTYWAEEAADMNNRRIEKRLPSDVSEYNIEACIATYDISGLEALNLRHLLLHFYVHGTLRRPKHQFLHSFLSLARWRIISSMCSSISGAQP
jgi:hypothetical protein